MPSPGPLEFLIVALILAMFVVPVVIVIRWLNSRPTATPASPAKDPAIEALRSRLAAGEIDEAEYLRLRSVLQRS